MRLRDRCRETDRAGGKKKDRKLRDKDETEEMSMTPRESGRLRGQ